MTMTAASVVTRFPGLSGEDFDVFAVPGLEGRMAMLRERLRPKLESFGATFAPLLTETLGEPMHAHVARHARRTTNPPNDSWVAFSRDARGYKKWPCFMIGCWQTHLFVQFGTIYESPLKGGFGLAVQDAQAKVRLQLGEAARIHADHTTAHGERLTDVTEARFREVCDRSAGVRQADLLFGYEWDRATVQGLAPDALQHVLQEALLALAPLYRLAFSGGID